MANGDASSQAFLTWQKVTIGLASLLASGFMWLEKDQIDHLGSLDQAVNGQTAALSRMAAAMDGLTQSNGRFDTALGKIYDRLHTIEVALPGVLADTVTNQRDIAMLRDEMNRHQAADETKWKSIGVTKAQ